MKLELVVVGLVCYILWPPIRDRMEPYKLLPSIPRYKGVEHEFVWSGKEESLLTVVQKYNAYIRENPSKFWTPPWQACFAEHLYHWFPDLNSKNLKDEQLITYYEQFATGGLKGPNNVCSPFWPYQALYDMSKTMVADAFVVLCLLLCVVEFKVFPSALLWSAFVLVIPIALREPSKLF